MRNAYESAIGHFAPPTGGATLLERDAATKAAVVKALRETDYAHLATHGKPEGVLLAGAAHQALGDVTAATLSTTGNVGVGTAVV